MSSPDIAFISQCFEQFDFSISTHGNDEMNADNVTRAMLRNAIGFDTPEIIEDYPEDKRGGSCLILGWMTPEQPLHAVVAYWAEEPHLITVYRPNLDKWKEDYRTRK
jgi:hypothetical protein